MHITRAIKRLEQYIQHGGTPLPSGPQKQLAGHGRPIESDDQMLLKLAIGQMQGFLSREDIPRGSVARESSAALRHRIAQLEAPDYIPTSGDVLDLLSWWYHIVHPYRLFDKKLPDDLTSSLQNLRASASRAHLEFIAPVLAHVPELFAALSENPNNPNGWLLLAMHIKGLSGPLGFSPFVLTIAEAILLRDQLQRCLAAEEYLMADEYPLLGTEELAWSFYSCRTFREFVTISRQTSFATIAGCLRVNRDKAKRFEFYSHRAWIADYVVEIIKTAPFQDNMFLLKVLLHFVMPFSQKDYAVSETAPSTRFTDPPDLYMGRITALCTTRVHELTTLLNPYASVRVETIDQLWRELAMVNANMADMPFGYGFHLMSSVGVTEEDASLREFRNTIADKFTDARQVVDCFARSELHQFCEAAAGEVYEKFGNRSAQSEWEASGLICNERNDITEFDRPERTRRIPGDQQTAETELTDRERAILSLAKYEWNGKFELDYTLYRQKSKPYGYFEDELSAKAVKLLELIDDEKLSKQSVSQILLKVEWPQVMRDIVLRRVILVLWENNSTLREIARRMGYLRKDQSGSGGLQQHLRRLRMPVRTVLCKWLTSKAIYEEERSWVRRMKGERTRRVDT